jgi:putative ABC transport system permease protein
MNGFFKDLRHALRQLRKSPGFRAAIIRLALSIGANTAIFSLLDQALLRSLPLKDVDRLIPLKYEGSDTGHLEPRSDGKFYFSYPMYHDLRHRDFVFSGLIATNFTETDGQSHRQPGLIGAERVTVNYFDVLGVRPPFGRLFLQSDEVVPDVNAGAVLGFSYCHRRFGVAPDIIAVTLLLSLLLMTTARSQLYGISSSAPLRLCLMTLLVMVVALASASCRQRTPRK